MRMVESLTAHGLHVYRAVGVFHIQVTLSHKVLEVTSTQLVDGILSLDLWHAVIEYFCKVLNGELD